MTAQLNTDLWCDDEMCGKGFSSTGDVGRVRDAAATFGWTYIHPGFDLCPSGYHCGRITRPAPEES